MIYTERQHTIPQIQLFSSTKSVFSHIDSSLYSINILYILTCFDKSVVGRISKNRMRTHGIEGLLQNFNAYIIIWVSFLDPLCVSQFVDFINYVRKVVF